ncbi:tyrosinase [Nitrosomonas cryotolerans]|uniref:Tyrosinase n=1 Tax=Nitrosomonas cryotolerans ATCC 49181 TaxID=1131553 RepID=A0A1N6G318_9PROT|nr:tyrosinase family protein [Nitrosomonas cryotolerans]SFQ16705.1 tyrosinase [Nitrosomonas cryotolerans]SIO01929.1 tyrosinase [Nitrosomonas cryotolerans ATCC 49181]
MKIRKNVRSLSQTEIDTLVNAFLELKKYGRYDTYVHWHHQVMIPSIWPWEPNDPDYRNGAHLGPSFLPWHREFLLQLEKDLQTIDRSITVPYWDWTEDAADPFNSPIWSDKFLGGNGIENDHWRVADGPFAHSNGNWPVPAYPEQGYPELGLKRQFGINANSLPDNEDLSLALRESFYDTPPYNSSPFTLGFRNRLEGWVTQRADSRVRTPGTQLHNRIHVWVGGNMLLMTSPDDPVFFLHHAFIDKVWADWQAIMAEDKPDWAPHYAPLKDGPAGHNLNDILKPWERRIKDVLDISALGYTYEQPAQIMKAMARPSFRSPFME